jgi:hypothetical protein
MPHCAKWVCKVLKFSKFFPKSSWENLKIFWKIFNWKIYGNILTIMSALRAFERKAFNKINWLACGFKIKF